MTHGYSTRPSWFVDPQGRPTLLRGVNLGGSTKVPFYVPRLHYPDVPEVVVSAGATDYDPASQLLTWSSPSDAGDVTISITPR